MNQPRLPWHQIAPKTFQAMLGVSNTIHASSIGKPLIDLVQSRVSQLNGCAYCLDMHVRDLRKSGDTWLRINSLATWREVPFFSARERAALGWAETLTRLTEHHGSRDADYEALKAQFSEQEIVELTAAIAQINCWNRMGVGMQLPVADKPIE